MKKAYVNGNEVKLEVNIRTFSDYECRVDITPFVKEGVNTLELDCVTDMYAKYRENVPFTMLTGDFGLDAEDKLVELPAVICDRSWETQGYTYYAGDGIYEMDYTLTAPCKKAVISFETHDVMQLYVNDEFVTLRPWEPYDIDITKYVKQGDNKIKVRITSSMGNMFMKFRSPSINGLTGPVKIKIYR